MSKNARIGVIGVIVLLVIVGAIVALKGKSSPTNSTTTNNNATTKTTDTSTVNNAILKTKSSASLGSYLTTASGQPLYTYSGDSANTSNCSGSCLSTWPAYTDSGATTGLPTNVGVITRTDTASKQYTYKGLPLYTFSADSGSQPTGNGQGGF